MSKHYFAVQELIETMTHGTKGKMESRVERLIKKLKSR
jgi:hypothetical protein